jgi:hypothetical protein
MLVANRSPRAPCAGGSVCILLPFPSPKPTGSRIVSALPPRVRSLALQRWLTGPGNGVGDGVRQRDPADGEGIGVARGLPRTRRLVPRAEALENHSQIAFGRRHKQQAPVGRRPRAGPHRQVIHIAIADRIPKLCLGDGVRQRGVRVLALLDVVDDPLRAETSSRLAAERIGERLKGPADRSVVAPGQARLLLGRKILTKWVSRCIRGRSRAPCCGRPSDCRLPARQAAGAARTVHPCTRAAAERGGCRGTPSGRGQPSDPAPACQPRPRATGGWSCGAAPQRLAGGSSAGKARDERPRLDGRVGGCRQVQP